MKHASINLLIAACVFACLSQRAAGFNMAVNDQDAKYIVSPVVHRLGRKISPTGPRQLVDDADSTFFGYSLSLFKSKQGDRIRLMIGSPDAINASDPSLRHTQSTDYEPMGNTQSCKLNRMKPFNTSTPSCVPAYPPDHKQGDGYGLSLVSGPNGQTVACSSIKEEACGAMSYTPGTCYKSKDNGKRWRKYGGQKSSTCPTTTVDVLFVLDGSGSVGSDFVKVKIWVKNIASKLNFTNVKVGVVQYSHFYQDVSMLKQPYIRTHILIGAYSNHGDFANKVDKIRLFGSTTYTGQALRKIMYDFNSTDNYNKSTNKQVMLLLTDGRATDSKLVPVSAKELRDNGIIPYAVGVGENINKTELQMIANGEKDNNLRVLNAEDFNDLNRIANELETEIQNIALEGNPNSKTVQNDMQFGEVGLSGKFSREKYPPHRAFFLLNMAY